LSNAFLATIVLLSAIATATASLPEPAFGTLPTSFTSTIFPAPAVAGSHGLAVDSNGIVWWVPVANQLVRQDPSFPPGDPSGFTIIATPHAPVNIAIDDQDNVWISNDDGFVTKYDPVANSFTNFGPVAGCFFLDHIHIHTDGKVYTTCLDGALIIRIDPGSGALDTFPTPTPASATGGITGDFTGILWSIERSADNVVRADPALMVPGTSSGITEFAIPTAPSNPETIKACGDRIWFTQLSGFGPVRIGVIDRVSNILTEVEVDPGASGGTYGLVLDGDGNPWVTNPENPKIYGFDISTNTVTTFSTPTTAHHIAISPSGELWYTDFAAEVVRLTPNVPLKPPCLPTAPPPAAPPPAEPKTMGFWKNHESATMTLLPRTLGTHTVDTLAKAKAVFDAADAHNAHNMLAAQLLAAKLNKANGVPNSCVATAISAADGVLPAAGYTGPDTTTPPQKAAKDAVNALKDELDKFNQNGC
jgi:streptogramin lyase